jgi:hypothetical protein
MGITISRTVHEPVTTPAPTLDDSKKKGAKHDDEDEDDNARLKITSQSVKPFSGQSSAFAKWKNNTECVFNGTGYERILTNAEYALTHPKKNSMVYSQLTISTDDGSASHLVSQHKETQDGHQAWQALLGHFHGSKISIRTAKAIREKLSRLQFYEGTSASDYINKFQTWHRDLERINNGTEGYSAATKLESFTNNIKHPKYAMQVGHIKNIPDLDMSIAIDKIRETEMELESARGEKRKMSVIRRRIYIEDGLKPPDDEDDLPSHVPITPSPRVKKRRRVDSNTKLPKEVQLKISGCIHITDGTWSELLQSDKEFVIEWNSRAKHGESTKDIAIPTGVTLLPHIKSAGVTLKRIRRQIQEAQGPTVAMLKANKKRIHFNLEGEGDDSEDVDPDMD